MERWSGKVAIVTGASAGIGAAIAEELVKKGLKVVGLARRAEKIEELAASLQDAPGKLYALKADVSKEEDILSAFKWVKENLGGVDVMVNNAGVLVISKLSEGKTEDWRQIYDINVLALSICTREALKSMKERGVDDGHIIHINSLSGQRIPDFDGAYVYSSSKHAVTVLTEGLRRELNSLKSKIKITSISPGVVETPILAGLGLPEEAHKDIPMLKSEDIAEAVIYTLSTPPHVQVHEITIYPTGQKT